MVGLTARDFSCGWFGGAAGILTSHPLDTVRVQVQVRNITIWSSVQNILRTDGVAGFFKGIISPVVCVGMWKATIFCVHANLLANLERNNRTRLAHSSTRTTVAGRYADRPLLKHHALAASAGGFLGSFVIVPMEMVKCNAQTTDMKTGKKTSALSHELGIARRILATKGVGGLWRGASLCAAGGMLSMPVWFVGNEALLRWRAEQRGVVVADVPFWERVLCGAASGTASWVPCYPFDKMKTIWQTQGRRHPRASMGALLRAQLRRNGGSWSRLLYGGFGATALRGIPQCGVTMAVYDWVATSTHMRE